jgi:hypothetical protein
MGDLVTLAAISAAASATGTVMGIANNQRARKAQEQAQDVQRASNKAQQLEEQRRQIREERVKRARILQASENTGVAGSSGEAGAISSLSTQLNSNIGYNLAAIDRGATLSALQQESANAQNTAQAWSAFGQLGGTAGRLGTSIFSSNMAQTSNELQGPFINGFFPEVK